MPVVLSPICWIEPRAMAALATDRLGRLANRAKWRLKALVPRWPTWRRDLLRSADVILPNSEAEGSNSSSAGSAPIPSKVRPGAQRRRGAIRPRRPGGGSARPTGTGDFVLYVGRIEPRKNVLGLVEGAKAAGLPLVVIGDALPGYEGLRRRLQAARRGLHPLAPPGRPRRPDARIGLRRRPGPGPAELVRDPGPGRPRGGAGGHGGGRHAPRLHPRILRRPGGLRPARPTSGRSPGPSPRPGRPAPTPGSPGTSARITPGPRWPGGRRRLMSRSIV